MLRYKLSIKLGFDLLVNRYVAVCYCNRVF